jgi:mannose-6-phosphate isomerase-like protein (cupin superfamily)
MVKEMSDSCFQFDFQKATGYVVSHPQGLIAIGHTASVPPWNDPKIHQHNHSEEYYFLLKGQLEIFVRDFQITLHPNEILMVKSGIPHAIVGGEGKIEHFGIRTPALDDKQVVGELEKDAPRLYENERLISDEWGHRISLDMPQHKNCWLIGAGSALYQSEHLIMAYLDFPTKETANAGIGTRHQLHLHQKSWEYYVVLKGEKILLIENSQVAIHAGEILAVPPNVKHTLHSRQAPYQGFTIRVPVELNDKITAEI